MSWTDKASINHIKKLRDLFNIKTFVETGTFRGINARLQSNIFDKVITCESNDKYYEEAFKKLKKIKNVMLIKEDSKEFLKRFTHDELIIFYLDAHFYDPDALNKFIVLDELESLEFRQNSIIVIHDFDNNLGHITYDGQPLNFELLKKKLLKVNPHFKFYTNELKSCDIVKPTRTDIAQAGLKYDNDTLDNLQYAWTKPEKTYRGFLYAIPEEVEIDGLKRIKC